MANRKIAFISRLKAGAEQQLIQDVKTAFPSEALHDIDGLENITICQGNGMFVAFIEYDGDFEKIYSEYISNPAVQAFHSKLAQCLTDIPKSNKPAELPIVGDVLYWDGKKVQEAAG
jgi:hypothetical protein